MSNQQNDEWNEFYWESRIENAMAHLKLCGYDYSGMDEFGNYLFKKDGVTTTVPPEMLIEISNGEYLIEDCIEEHPPCEPLAKPTTSKVWRGLRFAVPVGLLIWALIAWAIVKWL